MAREGGGGDGQGGREGVMAREGGREGVMASEGGRG